MSELIEAIGSMSGLVVLLFFVVSAGMIIALFDDDRSGISLAKILPILAMLVFMFTLMPNIVDTLQGNGTITSRGTTEIHVELMLEYKEIHYNRRLFGWKESYIFTLSDGENYRVPKAVYERYDIGEMVTIIKTDKEVKFK